MSMNWSAPIWVIKNDRTPRFSCLIDMILNYFRTVFILKFPGNQPEAIRNSREPGSANPTERFKPIESHWV